MTRGRETIRVIKKKLNSLLKSSDFEKALEEILRLPRAPAVNALFSFLYHEDTAIKWHAVTALGALVSKVAREDMEAARIVMRRLMWNLNDESGGIGWGSPEAMGEILASDRDLALDYAPILISYLRENGNFQEHPLMQRGVLWGIGRLAGARPGLLQEAVPHIIPYLDSPDATLRGLAVWVIGMLGPEEAGSRLEELRNDENQIRIYIGRRLIRRSVGDLAEEALKRLK